MKTIIGFYTAIAIIDYVITKNYTRNGIKMILQRDSKDLIYNLLKILCIPYIKLSEFIELIVKKFLDK